VINLYEKTVGYENDDTAKLAMKKALKKEEMYNKQENEGLLSKKQAGKAAANSFMIADLYRFNNSDVDEKDKKKSKLNAAAYYNRTLNRIIRNPVAIIENQTSLRIKDKPKKTRINELPPEFMINRAEDFYEDYINQLIQNGEENDEITTFVPDFHRIRDVVREARVKVAEGGKSSKPKPKTESLKTYYAEKDITNDPQNVHDSQVNNDTKTIYDMIVEKNNKDVETGGVEQSESLEDVRQEMIKYKFPSEEHRDRALLIFSKFNEGNEHSNLETTEDQILLNVWNRINSPENKEKKEDLKSALFDSMADSMDVDN